MGCCVQCSPSADNLTHTLSGIWKLILLASQSVVLILNNYPKTRELQKGDSVWFFTEYCKFSNIMINHQVKTLQKYQQTMQGRQLNIMKHSQAGINYEWT